MSTPEAVILQSPSKRHGPAVVTLGVIVWFLYMIPVAFVAVASVLGSIVTPIAVPLLLHTSDIPMKYVFGSGVFLLVVGIVGGIRAEKVRVKSGRLYLGSLYGIRAMNPFAIYGWHGPCQIFLYLQLLREIGEETMEGRGSFRNASGRIG